MRPALELTSVPPWAVTATRPRADTSGRYWTVIAFGAGGDEVVRDWSDEIYAAGRESGLRIHRVDEHDADAACAALVADVAGARVGWRLMLAGPANACLRVRATALDLGIADDEIVVASTEVGLRTVQCVHCRAVTSVRAELEDVVPCVGCSRNLVVYYHVSRRQGAHLGFMIDAEEVAS